MEVSELEARDAQLAHDRLHRVMSINRQSNNSRQQRQLKNWQYGIGALCLSLLVLVSAHSSTPTLAPTKFPVQIVASESIPVTDIPIHYARTQTTNKAAEDISAKIMVVVFSTMDKSEAMRFADQLAVKEDRVHVVRSNTQYYAVALGKFSEEFAAREQVRMQEERIAPDAYLMNTKRIVKWLPMRTPPSPVRVDERMLARG